MKIEFDSKAAESFSYFMENVFGEYYKERYGKWVCGDYLKSLAFLMQHQDHLIAAIPRGHGKTTLTVGYACWLAYNLKQNSGKVILWNSLIDLREAFKYFGFYYCMDSIGENAAIRVYDPRGKDQITFVFRDFDSQCSAECDAAISDDTDLRCFKAYTKKTIALGTPSEEDNVYNAGNIKFRALNRNGDALFPELFSSEWLRSTKKTMSDQAFYREFLVKA